MGKFGWHSGVVRAKKYKFAVEPVYGGDTSVASEVAIITKVGVPGATTFAAKGSLCIDYTNANLYINAGTLASPSWKLVTRAG